PLPLLRLSPVDVEGLGQQVHVALLEQTDRAEHPAEAARGERAAAEAQKEDLVGVAAAGIVVVGDEAVAVQDVLRQAHADRALDPVDRTAGPESGVVEGRLAAPVATGRQQSAQEL